MVVFASVVATAPTLSQRPSVLSPAEKNRMGRFFRQADRDRYLVAHTITRLLLADAVGHKPGAIHIQYGSDGKPRLSGLAGATIEFSYSYSGDLAVIAISEFPIGVDVQALDGLSDATRLIDDVTGEFTWARHEAVGKVHGLGVDYVGRFDVSGQSQIVASDRSGRLPPVMVFDIDVGAEAICAVATTDLEARIILKPFQVGQQ